MLNKAIKKLKHIIKPDSSVNYTNEARLFGLIWFATIAIFLVFISFLSNNAIDFSNSSNSLNEVFFVIFLLNIFVGFIAFPLLILNIFRHIRSKQSSFFSHNSSLRSLILFVGILVILSFVGQKTGFVEFASFQTSSSPLPTPWSTTEPIPIPSLTPIGEPIAVPTINTQQKANTNQVTGDGSRTGRIVLYKEYCSGNQISVYENEILAKVSPYDGKTYGMTQGDWDCYNADPVINCNLRPECGGGTIQTRKSVCEQSTCCRVGNVWNTYPNTQSCTQAQNSYNANRETYSYTPPILPKFDLTPFTAVAPYQPSQEYTDTYNKNMQEINKDWKPTQFVAPTPKCYATWDEYFNAHPNYAPVNIAGTSPTPPCD